MQDIDARLRRRRENYSIVLIQAGLGQKHDTDHRIQCRITAFQNYKLYGMGRRGAGKAKIFVDSLFLKVEGLDLCSR